MRLFSSMIQRSSRVANFRTAAFNIYLHFGTTTKKTAIANHIRRVDADFVTLTETDAADMTYAQSFYTEYSYFSQLSTGGLQVMAMSKYEIITAEEIIMSGRNPLYNEIIVNGKKIGIVSHHNASWCASPPCNTLPTELPNEPMAHDRMVQLYMTLKFLEDKKAADPTLYGFIIQGDWNDDILHLQVQTYNANVSGGMGLPAYLSYPLENAQFPLKPLTFYDGIFTLDLSTDGAGSTHTIWDDVPNAALTLAMRMDYVAYSDGLGYVGGEILNSEVDNNSGLPKVGNPLASGDSRAASDHKLVFTDLIV